MSIRDALLGRPLASSEEKQERLGVLTGVPVLGLDALASTGYGPEAALTVLLPLGAVALRYYPFIILAVVFKLATLYLSYRQTAAAYPDGGGAYIVAGDNLGPHPGLWAAVSLVVDYLLNVAVGISAGTAAVISAIPSLQPHTLALCLVVLATLTLVNLRGVRESGAIFVAPVLVFIGCMATAIAIGLVRAWHSSGHPVPIVAPPPFPAARTTPGAWLILAAFANGCTAMTGIEAVSNGVPLFREPRVANAQWTLTAIVGILGVFLLGIGYLCPAYHITAMDERSPGYQTILSQLIAATAGRGVFYYLASASIFVVLTYSAQTSFADFPRVCRLLAEDEYLPAVFASRGRRLVYSHGIVLLAIVSAIILIVFQGVTDSLIPLFAVGAFGAFLLSQAGMVVHWIRRRGRGWAVKLFYNGLGAATTLVALGIIIVAKFSEGAWITIIVIPSLILLFGRIKRHYEKVAREIERPLRLPAREFRPPTVVVPIKTWNRVAEKAVEFALRISDDVVAVHVAADEPDRAQRLRALWKDKVEEPASAAQRPVPSLAIIDSPYRELLQPIAEFVDEMRRKNPDRLVAVVIPELVEPRWYEYLLHDLHAVQLRVRLYLRGDGETIVIRVPWRLHEN